MPARQVEVVVGLHNRGAADLNVTMLQGSLNSVQNFAMYFQNFTEQARGAPCLLRRRGLLWRDPGSDRVHGAQLRSWGSCQCVEMQ